MYIEVEGIAFDRIDEVYKAIKEHWAVEDDIYFTDDLTALSVAGDGYLAGGISEEEMADAIIKAVWEANGAYCRVTVSATYMENLPHESYSYDRDKYNEEMG